ncbi:MAG: DUF2306 domain-containing protein [Acidimicrobiales bacterium]
MTSPTSIPLTPVPATSTPPVDVAGTASGPSPTSPPAVTGTRRRRRGRRLAGAGFVVLCLAIGFGAPLPYFVVSWDDLAAADQGLAAHYVDQPAPIRTALLIHAGFAGLAMVLTPVQGSSRRRWPALHRASGRVSALAIALGAATGLVVAQVSYAGLSGRIGFSTLSVVWVYATWRAISGARRGDLATHRRWAVRVMALTFAAVTLRLWVGLWVAISVAVSGTDPSVAFDQMYVLTPFLSWIPNLVAVEWSLRRTARR